MAIPAKETGNILKESLLILRERKRILDAVCVMSLGVVFLTVGIPWFLGIINLNIVPVAWVIFGYALAYLVLATLTDRLEERAQMLLSMQVLQSLGVVALALLWHLAGGMANPMFLMVFTLPVIASGVMMLGWQSYFLALISVIAVSIVAIVESPELKWYLTVHSGRGWDWLENSSIPFTSSIEPFPDLETGLGFQLMILGVFSLFQFTSAALSGSLNNLLLRIHGRLQSSTRALEEIQGIFQSVLHAAPEPGLIIFADSKQVVYANESFIKGMLLKPEAILGKGLFEVMNFSQPERVAEVIEKGAGHVSFCTYYVEKEVRIANILVYRTEHVGTAYIYVGIQDLTDLYYLDATFNAMEDPLMVIGADNRLLYANKISESIVGKIFFGMDMTELLRLPGMTKDWWQEKLMPTEKWKIESSNKPYEVTKKEVALPGASRSCVVLTFHDVEKEEALFKQAIHDPLTGIYNRRYFEEMLTRHMGQVKRGTKLTFAYLDMDRFKTINDTLGHAGGDAAIVTFVETVRSELRSAEILARLGGDEFALLLPGSDAKMALIVIERIRQRFIETPFTFMGQSFYLGFSAGVATAREEDKKEDLVTRADKALYRAKEGGRNRSEVEEQSERIR